MLLVIYGIAIVGGFCLAAATAWLVWMNWSTKLYSPLLSIFLGGTVTTFITVVALLKESSVADTFVTSVAFDTSISTLPLLIPDPSNLKTTMRLSELGSLARGVTNVGGVSKLVAEPPMT